MEGDNDVNVNKAKFLQNVKVNVGNEPIKDMCLMDSGDLLLTDFINQILKRYSSDLQYKDEIELPGGPVAVCKIDEHTIAVRTSYRNGLHIVLVGQSMLLVSTFTLADNGLGMAYDNDTGGIFACEGNKVSVYSKTGNKLRSYEKDTNGEPMFSLCVQIALCKNGNNVYVTDYKRGVIVFDKKKGNLKMKIILSEVKDTYALCLLPGRNLLIGSYHSGVFVQVDEEGKQVGTLIDTTDGRKWTYCVVYDEVHSRLIVGGYPSDIISIYSLSDKSS